MDKKEILDAIEAFGQYLVDYAKEAKKDLNLVEETDLKAISKKLIKPALGISFKSPYLEAKKQKQDWEKIVRNFTQNDQSEDWGKTATEDAFNRWNKKS